MSKKRLQELYAIKDRINHADRLSSEDRERISEIEREIRRLQPKEKIDHVVDDWQGPTLEDNLKLIKEKFGRKKMTEEKQLQPWQGAIANSARKFNEIVENTGNRVAYASESMFALQLVGKNDYLMKVANSRPDTLRDAVINIASIGLSLNPAMQYAYLVPRDGIACLDISYKGLIKLATDSGSMMWVRADLVYENDKFTYRGPAEKPIHEADVFGDRGSFRGVYCVAKTLEGDFLSEVMTAAEIEKVRDTSQAWKQKKAGPWKDWFGEMAKKSIIKRASKTWPRSDKNDRLAKAIQILNENDGHIDDREEIKMISEDQAMNLESLISDNDINKDFFLSKIASVNEIRHITASDYQRCLQALTEKIRRKNNADS